MTERSFYWAGTSVGDASLAPYDDEADYAHLWRNLFTINRQYAGVLGIEGGMLEVTNPAGATARVASGCAIVDGKFYENTANIDFTVSGTSVWWVVGLVRSTLAQTVRAFARGPYASDALAIASLVQTDNDTWEIPLATVLTTAGGLVSSITDHRGYCRYGNATFARRQGGSPTLWQNPGTTGYNVPFTLQQFGVISAAGGGVASGTISVSFPTGNTYRSAYTPIVFVTPAAAALVLYVSNVTNTGFDINWSTPDGAVFNGTVMANWLAIGMSAAYGAL